MPSINLSFRVNKLSVVALIALMGIIIGVALEGTADSFHLNSAQTLPWIIEGASAFAAYWVITASVIVGLLLSTRILNRATHGDCAYSMQSDLALIGLGLAGVHGTLIVVHQPLEDAINSFVSPGIAQNPMLIGLGQVSLFILASAVAMAWSRKHAGHKNLRVLFALTLIVFALSSLHAFIYRSGLDDVWFTWIYAATTAMVALLISYRFYRVYLKYLPRKMRGLRHLTHPHHLAHLRHVHHLRVICRNESHRHLS